jgi:predicted short-subunit dehydrogenase-like oxidoreductase (DUF2520 family)
MKVNFIDRLTVIGTGNVAEHLVKTCCEAGFRIVQVSGRDEQRIQHLAGKAGAAPVLHPAFLTKNSDLIIIAVSDDSIGEVIRQIPFRDTFVVHTSGTTHISVFENRFEGFGVIYPLQTFSKNIDVDMKQVPFCIEANDEDHSAALEAFASRLSDRVYKVSSGDRQIIHLAAVFASNFSNHLFGIAFDLLSSTGAPSDILVPLIQETARKAGLENPFDIQTGPAARNDENVMERHLSLLEGNPEYHKLYRLLSEAIINKHHGSR